MRAKSIHTISLLASAIAMALPSSTQALGLGRLTVQSALGQPLSAQIELTSAARDELDSLAAKVADPSLYRQNNLTYQGVLSRARVSLERRQDGQAFLKVVTPTAVNEPYLDLMVELNWAAGRVVREYTFLLDPPGLAAPTPTVEPVTPVRAGTTAPRRAAAAAAATGPTAAAPAAAAPASGARRATAAAAPADSYSVHRGDSLARVANQLRPDSVSLEQMLVALFRANPNAFDGQNMNRLRAGAILTVPPVEQIAGTPEAEATKVVRMQAADWRTYRDRVAASAPVTESAGGRGSGGRITTAVEERTPAAQPGRDQVRVSREAGVGRGGAGAAEDVIAQERALKDAQSRIVELEKTLKDLQHAIEMRSQTMAQLQKQAATGNAKPADTAGKAGAAAAHVAAAAPSSAAPTAPATAPAVASKAAEPTRVGPDSTATTSEPGSVPQNATPPVSPPAATPAASVSASPAKPQPAKPVVKPTKAAPAAAPSLFDDVLGTTSPWALGAGVLVVLGGIGALVMARRRKSPSFEDSIISGTDIKSNTVFGSTGGGIVNTGENSLSSDFSREGISTIDTDEVDPIAEAEVYLAYGRDAQAEEILKEALKRDPQRQEVYLKLLEIHAQHNKPSAFEAVAAELYSVSQGQGEIWQKAAALGRQLDPNSPMFAEDRAAAAAAAAATSAAAGAGALQARSDAGPSAERPPEAPRRSDAPPVPVGVADLGHDHGLDFRLDEDISISPSSAPPRKSSEVTASADVSKTDARGPALDFITNPGDSQAPERVTVGELRREPVHADSGFDLEFHLDEADRPTPFGGAQSFAAEPAPARNSDAAPSLARPQAAIDLDKLDLSFDPDRTTFEDPTPSVLDGQWHDAATKLDLAKAYQEMGDVEGAREILQEVLHEGDEQQKSEAAALLQKLG